MKEKHVENAGTLPSSVTARVSNAIRAEGRVVVARVIFWQPTSPEGGMHYGSSEEEASEEEARAQDRRGEKDDGEKDGHRPSQDRQEEIVF